MTLFKGFKRKYHISINTLPIANYKECEKGNLQYLYKLDFFEMPKSFPENFTEVFENMIYQFEKLDNTLSRLLNKVYFFENKYVHTGNPKFSNKARFLMSDYERILGEKMNTGNQTLTEQSVILNKAGFNVNIYKTTTQYWYSCLYALAQQNEKKDV